jgi:NAD(P)-dependent dehydrogenase (short-subunit alcohol dehydrogenase family)
MRVKGRLEGKVAVVTGGTSGIGESVSRLFAAEGAKLVILGQKQEPGLSLIRELGEDNAVFISGDVSQPETGKRVVEAALLTFGRLNVLINNAAIDYVNKILDTPLADAMHVMNVNYFGAFIMLQECASIMSKSGGGSIVNVISRNALVGVPTMGAYAAAKSALLGLTRTSAIELAESNVRVNAVAPGITRTPLIQKWIEEQEDPVAFELSVASSNPQGRFATPEEVAYAILFLATDESSHITGTSLSVDGGYTAK